MIWVRLKSDKPRFPLTCLRPPIHQSHAKFSTLHCSFLRPTTRKCPQAVHRKGILAVFNINVKIVFSANVIIGSF